MKINRNDIEDAKRLNDVLVEFKKLLDGHATSNKNYPRKIGVDLYARNYYNLLIFDELINGEYCDINIIRNNISHKIPKEFDNRYSHELAIHVYELCRRQLIEYKNENNTHILLKITQKGIDAYNDNTFLDLATTSFYGYQAFRLSKITVITAILAILVSVIALGITTFKEQSFSFDKLQMESIKSDLRHIEQKINNK